MEGMVLEWYIPGRTLEGHEGSVLAIQQKEDILISGSRDKIVSTACNGGVNK